MGKTGLNIAEDVAQGRNIKQGAPSAIPVRKCHWMSSVACN
jgi:hypothetical protein